MTEIFNLPTEETLKRIANAQEKIANTRVQEDFTQAPGSKYLLAGDRDAGFFGFVHPTDLITGDALASDLAITAGTSQNSDVAWIKYIWQGKICFTPVKTFRYSIPWNAIYEAGAVYASGDEGTLPPEGRLGTELEITNSNTITTTGNFQGDKSSGDNFYDTVGSVGDTIVLKGWSNGANNGEFTIDTISDTTITVVEGGLVAEVGDRNSSLHPKANEVTQNATVVIGGLTYRVRLFRGAAEDPTNSYADSDKGSIGEANEWNAIILPLHKRAKLQDWNYPEYVGDTEYWEVDLTDENLRTHRDYGNGSRSWCQEVRDYDETFRRVTRGGGGASHLFVYASWGTNSDSGWRPVLELLG